MRIISGSLRRRSILVPGGDAVRPTTDRTREAIFSILSARMDLDGSSVLDLFAGSGALGLEAISRGAVEAVFVEKDARTAQVIRENTEQLGVESRSTIRVEDATRFLERYEGPSFDVVFADPPYNFSGIADLPGQALRAVRDDGLLILEHDRRYDFSGHEGVLTSRSYGRTHISLFSRRGPEHVPE